MRRPMVLMAVLLLGGMVACTDDDGSVPEFSLRSSPEFVNRLVPGNRPLALVTTEGGGDREVTLTATTSLAGAAVTLQPASLTQSEVSEVWIEIPAVTEDSPFTVVVTGRIGSTERTVTIDATAVAGTDDLQSTALEVVGIFLDHYAATVPELPADPAGLSNGSPVAGLLVVSHYAWFTPEYEIGLAWHIMIAPDDFAELYIRPRGELAPTKAFRVNSWQTALQGGDVTFTEPDPPAEVTR